MKREAAYVFSLVLVLATWVTCYNRLTAGTNNPDMVVTLLTPTNGSLFATVISTNGTTSNIIQLAASVSFKEKLAAPIIDRIK